MAGRSEARFRRLARSLVDSQRLLVSGVLYAYMHAYEMIYVVVVVVTLSPKVIDIIERFIIPSRNLVLYVSEVHCRSILL